MAAEVRVADVVRIARMVARGELTHDEADAAIVALAGPDDEAQR